jgi:hypothetical protein
MKQTKFLKSLEERPLRMAFEPKLPRPQIVIRRAPGPVPASNSPLAAIVIVTLAFWLIYAIFSTVPA